MGARQLQSTGTKCPENSIILDVSVLPGTSISPSAAELLDPQNRSFSGSTSTFLGALFSPQSRRSTSNGSFGAEVASILDLLLLLLLKTVAESALTFFSVAANVVGSDSSSLLARPSFQSPDEEREMELSFGWVPEVDGLGSSGSDDVR